VKIASFRFEYEVLEELDLINQPRSQIYRWIRGSSYRLNCIVPKTPCRDCVILSGCPHTLLFEPALRFSTGRSEYASLFAFAPPERRRFSKGESLTIPVTLIEEAVYLLPMLLVMMGEMAERKLYLKRVFARKASEKTLIYDGVLRNEMFIVDISELLTLKPHTEEVKLRFISPPILEGRMEISVPPMYIQIPMLIDGILNRLGALMEVKGKQPDFSLDTLLDLTQRAKGFPGENEDELMLRNVEQLIPLLTVGEWIQIGKHVERGFGKYEIIS